MNEQITEIEESIKKLNVKIEQLTSKRIEIINIEKAKQKEKFLTLEWLKDFELTFAISYWNNVPFYELNGTITQYIKNMVYGNFHYNLFPGVSISDRTWNDSFVVSFNDPNVFLKFIKDYDLKIKLEPDFAERLFIYQGLDKIRKAKIHKQNLKDAGNMIEVKV